MSRNKRNFLLVEHGGSRKQFTLDVLLEEDINIYIATSTMPEWLTEYVPKEHIIQTDTYNSVSLLSDIVTYFESRKITLHAMGTFFEHTVTQTADVAHALGLIGIDPGAARRSSCNKLLMRIYCRNAKIPTPRFTVLQNIEVQKILNAIESVGIPCVIKPIFGSESYGTIKIEENYNIQDIISEIHASTGSNKKEVFKNFNGTFLLEEYLPGPVISVDGIVVDNTIHVAGIVEFIMGPEPRFTQEANYIPARFPEVVLNQAIDMTKEIIKTLGFNNTGFHCELRITPEQGPILLEIAARLPGGPLQPGHLKSSGINLTKELLHVWLGDTSTIKSERKHFILQKAVFPKRSGKIIRTYVPKDIANNKTIWDFAMIVEPNEEIVTYPNIPKPFYYYAIHASSKEALEELSVDIESRVLIEIQDTNVNHEVK